MADLDFEKPSFDPDEPGIDDDYSFDLHDAIMDPPLRVQQDLNTSRNHIQSLLDELREAELEAKKEVTQVLRPDSIDYDQFRIDDDGKTLYWTPGDKKIPISTTRGGVRFLVLSILASRYGVGGTDAVRRSLGLTGYIRKGLSSSAVKALQLADKTLPSNLDHIELEDFPGIADSARQSAEQVECTLTTIDDQPIDTVWVTQARRELTGLEKAMTGMRDELANNLSKLTSIDERKSEVERHLAREHRKLTETDDTEMKRERFETESESSRVYSLTSSLRDRQGSKPSLRTEQPSVPRSTESVRHSGGSSMKTPLWLSAFAPCFVSKELPSHRFSQPSAWQSRHLCLRSPVVGGSAPVPAPKQPDKSGLKEWVKKHLQALGLALANFAGKAAAALPGIIGKIVS